MGRVTEHSVLSDKLDTLILGTGPSAVNKYSLRTEFFTLVCLAEVSRPYSVLKQQQEENRILLPMTASPFPSLLARTTAARRLFVPWFSCDAIGLPTDSGKTRPSRSQPPVHHERCGIGSSWAHFVITLCSVVDGSLAIIFRFLDPRNETVPLCLWLAFRSPVLFLRSQSRNMLESRGSEVGEARIHYGLGVNAVLG